MQVDTALALNDDIHAVSDFVLLHHFTGQRLSNVLTLLACLERLAYHTFTDRRCQLLRELLEELDSKHQVQDQMVSLVVLTSLRAYTISVQVRLTV